ncbi:MAG: S24/S26 family peptidase [Planctomycetes bacterium]|nr:S24/S26 family peptidase [Planctomycetota bacterium]
MNGFSPLRLALDCCEIIVTVRGESMRPSLRPGDRVIVERCLAADLRPGDIVVLDSDPPLIHRFLGRCDAGLILAGDGNRAIDHPRDPELVVGRAVAKCRRGARLRLRRRSFYARARGWWG